MSVKSTVANTRWCTGSSVPSPPMNAWVSARIDLAGAYQYC